MAKDGIKDAAAQVRSRIKQAVSKITGDAKTPDAKSRHAKTAAEGAAEDVLGKAERAAVRAKVAARDTAKE